MRAAQTDCAAVRQFFSQIGDALPLCGSNATWPIRSAHIRSFTDWPIPSFSLKGSKSAQGLPIFSGHKNVMRRKGLRRKPWGGLGVFGFWFTDCQTAKTLFKTVTIQLAACEYLRQFNALRIASAHLSHQSRGPKNPGAACILAKQQLRPRTEVLFFFVLSGRPGEFRNGRYSSSSRMRDESGDSSRPREFDLAVVELNFAKTASTVFGGSEQRPSTSKTDGYFHCGDDLRNDEGGTMSAGSGIAPFAGHGASVAPVHVSQLVRRSGAAHPAPSLQSDSEQSG